MPVTNWNTTVIDGKNWLVIDLAKLRVPLDWDASSNVFLAVAAPDGIDGDALLSYPALVQGDKGDPPTLDTDINTTVLAYDDATPDSMSWTETSPGVYQLTATQRTGPTGLTGPQATILGASDISGTPTAKQVIIVNDTATGVTFATQKVGDWYIPASIANTPSGNPGYTLCPVAIPAQNFDWRPTCEGMTIVTGTGTSVVTDLLARLNNATSGNIVARCFGLTSTERLILSSGPAPGSADGYDRVSAGVAATLYLRAERQSGTDTFTTSGTTSRFRVKVDPIP